MANHHTEAEVFQFLTGDFEQAWDALARTPASMAPNRCNFFFALLAAAFLEWCARLCKSDATGEALRTFENEIKKIEPRYFTQLPGVVRSKTDGEFVLPGEGTGHSRTLLVALWDLIRNGQAHEYQDILVDLKGKHWSLAILGVEPDQTLADVVARRASLEHLSFRFDTDGDLILRVHPALLFSDLKAAALAACLLKRKLTIQHLSRPRGAQGYDFDIANLEFSLTSAGHTKLP